MLNKKCKEIIKLGLRDEEAYCHIYGINSENDSKCFEDIPNELECTIHKNIDITGAKFVLDLLDLIKDIYKKFGYESFVLSEYIEGEMVRIYGEGYNVEDIMR